MPSNRGCVPPETQTPLTEPKGISLEAYECGARDESPSRKRLEVSPKALELLQGVALSPEFNRIVAEVMPPHVPPPCPKPVRTASNTGAIHTRSSSRCLVPGEAPRAAQGGRAFYLSDLTVDVAGSQDTATLRNWRGVNLSALGILPSRPRSTEGVPRWKNSYYGDTLVEDLPEDAETIFECVDCPCTAGPSAGFIQKLWIELANTVVSGADKRDLAALPDPATPYTFEFGGGLVRTDFYAAVVCLGSAVSPDTILTKIRDDPNSLSGSAEFNDNVTWPKAGPGGRKDLDVVDLDIYGPDNGAIAYLDTSFADRFTVVTVSNRASGSHPVSGIRTWGFKSLNDLETMFYTASIESANAKLTGGVGALLQDATWVSLMEAVAAEAVAAGGERCEVYSASEWNSSGQSRRLKERKASGYEIDETHLDPPDSIVVEKLF